MRKKLFHLVILPYFIFHSACQKYNLKTITGPLPDKNFEQAMSLFNKGKYNQAIKLFQEIIFNYPTTTYAIDAQYYLGEAYFRKKDYRAAIQEYEFFLSNYPNNPYLEDVYYKLALAYFKYVPAIDRNDSLVQRSWELLEFLEENFCNNVYSAKIKDIKKEIQNRWAQKYYNIGYLYYRGGELDAAKIYFNFVLNEYPDTQWALQSNYMLARIYEARDSISQAVTIYNDILKRNIDSSLRELIYKRLNLIAHKK
jgi:outer membrane protein assembly factor BamD